MSNIKIVCDSTSDIPPQIAKKYDIDIIPANVIFDDNVYSQFDITNEEFYSRLRKGESPTTGVPSPRVFKQVYESSLETSSELIVLTLSKKLSGLNSTANMVASEFFDKKITVIDTGATTLQLGSIAIEAAKKANSSSSKNEIIDFINNVLIKKSQMLGVIDTLKYLRKGGRINTITWLLGSLLSIKPPKAQVTLESKEATAAGVGAPQDSKIIPL